MSQPTNPACPACPACPAWCTASHTLQTVGHHHVVAAHPATVTLTRVDIAGGRGKTYVTTLQTGVQAVFLPRQARGLTAFLARTGVSDETRLLIAALKTAADLAETEGK